MSPGFMPRPSLSDNLGKQLPLNEECVAGVYAPAFVERITSGMIGILFIAGVAGVYAPAFVERLLDWRSFDKVIESVAGVYAPAFVERRGLYRHMVSNHRVSPGFMPRPSLSGQVAVLQRLNDAGCRRGLCPGLR